MNHANCFKISKPKKKTSPAKHAILNKKHMKAGDIYVVISRKPPTCDPPKQPLGPSVSWRNP